MFFFRNSVPYRIPRKIHFTLHQIKIFKNDGAHCTSPNECGFKAHCWGEKKIPSLSVLDLPQIRDKKWNYYSQGIIGLDDPRLTELSPIQQRVVEVFKAGTRFVDVTAIKSAIATWKFPLVFLDFETINPAIPRYTGCGPYQHVPFQFSVHLWNSPDANVEHREFLFDSSGDPRPTLIPQLIEACKGDGSIVAYYGKFESDRISELIRFSPNHTEELESINARIVDPLPIFREHVYDNAFGGSFSLKAVAPAILGAVHSYDGMAVADGSAAQRAFEELISDQTQPSRKSELRGAMLEYCRKDTQVMVDLVKWLYEQAGIGL